MNRTRVSRLALPFAAFVALAASGSTFAACGPEAGQGHPPPSVPTPPPMPPVDASAPIDASVEPAPQPMPRPTLHTGAKSADPDKPLPLVTLLAPTKGQVVPLAKAGELLVKLDVKNWPTAIGGAHVHLILDNRPYKPIFDPSAPVKLKELAYGEPLTEGQHVLVAFPSRANHESVKTAGALFVTEFWIGKKGAATTDTSKPMLVYSRPKGDYKGTMAGHVLVDFQLWNAELGEKKHHVLVTVAGPGLDAPLVQKVQELGPPLYLDDARTGDYRIKLELADAEDKPVPGPWNATTREISIDRETLPDLGHSMDVADAGAKKK